MNKVTIAVFEALLQRSDWKHEQDLEIVDTHPVESIERDDDDPDGHTLAHVNRTFGCATKTSTLDGIVISYTEGFSFDAFDAGSFSTSNEGEGEGFTAEGLEVVDDDGEPMVRFDLEDYLPDQFSSIDYSSLEIEKTIDIDSIEENDMETFTLRIDNEPNIRFTGEQIGHVKSSQNNASSNYSGQTGRWTELALYRTKGGKYICHQIGMTSWQGEKDRYSGTVCETIAEVKAFFGFRWLAKELYSEAGIDADIEVE